MNILQITTYILCGLIGYIVIKFIYKNFFKPLERKEPEEKENIEEKQPEKPAEVSPLEFIINDTRSEGIDIEFIEKTITNYKFRVYYYSATRFRMQSSNEELLNVVVHQWGEKLKKEAFEEDVIHTGRYNPKDSVTDIDFHNVTSIMNVGETISYTSEGDYRSNYTQTKPERTIIVYGELMCEINLIQELPTLFNKWKARKTPEPTFTQKDLTK